MVTSSPLLAHDDSGSGAPLVVCLPGAGDLRSEFRLLRPRLSEMRLVVADLPGHGESAPAPGYGVAETAQALVALIDSLGAGPAVVVGCSFAPAAALWAAAEAPDRIAGIVAISPHVEADTSLKGRLQALSISALLRGPLAAPVWGRLYRGWYKSVIPNDLDDEIAAMSTMLGRPAGRRAVRETLVASRQGLEERMARLDLPTLTIFGAADDHFPDPAAECEALAARLGGRGRMVQGAGHYPHVEYPDRVADAIQEFVAALR